MTYAIRVTLPPHLRTLTKAGNEVTVPVEEPVTLGAVLDALESAHPVLRGTIRDHITHKRRAFIRFFVCGQDWSHEPVDAPLPDDVTNGTEPFMVVGAIAGG